MKFVVIVLVFLKTLYSYELNSYEVNTDANSVQKSIELLGGKEKANTYFHTYYLLLDAIAQGDIQKVQALVGKIGVEARVPYEAAFISPLMRAVKSERYEVAKYLLEHEADPNRYMDVRNTRETALMYAANKDNPKLVDLLLEYGADANLQDIDGYTALDHALGMGSMGNEEIIKTLIPLTELNTPIKQYTLTYKPAPATALTIALKFHRKYDIIDTLLDAGATAGISDEEKYEFLKAFLSYSNRSEDQNKLYTYSKMALKQTKNSHHTKVEQALIYLYAELYETAVITGHTLHKEELQGFVKLSQKYIKAKAYLEMFFIIEESQNPSVLPTSLAKSTEEWKKHYAHLVKNEWCFSALKQWAKTLDSNIQTSVTDTLEMLEDAIH
ncbi:ankyrin repeat domain-containing protein [Sulfurovum sp.]|uniref:ankyrin repeat domain-containing protein n=1 Tax=Sulfurovum sp. TaxID=1969726 RepID=UPI0025FA501A|nr:ankyrin repeat domain-containing protein [Sulfurovum sp.]